MNQYSRRDMLRLGVSASAALAGSVFLPVRAQDNPLYEAARKEGPSTCIGVLRTEVHRGHS